MPIVENVPIVGSDGEEYIWKGNQFRNIKTGRIASRKTRIELESRVIDLGLVTGGSIFQELLGRSLEMKLQAEATQTAIEWMREAAKNVGKRGSQYRGEILSEAEFIPKNRVEIGKPIVFQYEATTGEKLRYWDAFPVVIPIEYKERGFLGLNVHYLDPRIRAMILDIIYEFRSPKKVNIEDAKDMKKFYKSAKLGINYDSLKALGLLKYVRPMIHRYVGEGLKSRILEIPVRGWTAVMFLPVEDFRKATRERVWRESAAKINA